VVTRDPADRLRALAVETRAAARSPGRRSEREALLRTAASLEWTAGAIEEPNTGSDHLRLEDTHSAHFSQV
jgi:hypothetical protein